jgi:1-phosphofructokinase family hexose kinase
LIVTLTLNPAIDRNITVDRLAFEDRAYILDNYEAAGGRGINAASVIHSFGGDALAILTLGGEAGRRLREHLSRAGFRTVVVPITNEIRTNLTITDRHGLTVHLNEAGPHVTKAELHQVEQVIEKNLGSAAWLIIAGSIPPGVPPDFYAKLVAVARRKNVKTLLDADGDALREGIEAGPTVVSPNQQETERLLNRALLTRSHFLDAAERIRAMGAESVVLKLGSRGAVGAFPAGVIEALSPRIEAVSPIGAGDALAAALAWALARDLSYEDALRWGVATGTASARLPGMRFATLAQAEELYPRVEIRRVE